ncbi:hypothetical protein MKZ38_004158 [Zalerion maritima]|uniref:Uncharacterized protein n=1 Tax=Zalerion maritima TaxID=339359 RepID=A0AAD5RM02_9PEZI|nr:hypothetical protein MKZ38_004158 [Zalerion maritima]
MPIPFIRIPLHPSQLMIRIRRGAIIIPSMIPLIQPRHLSVVKTIKINITSRTTIPIVLTIASLPHLIIIHPPIPPLCFLLHVPIRSPVTIHADAAAKAVSFSCPQTPPPPPSPAARQGAQSN